MSFLPSYCFASINMMSMVLPCSSVIIIDIIRLIISMVIIPRWSSILKVVMKKFEISMESSDSNESEKDEEQMSQNTNSNSASVIVAGPTGVPGLRIIKFGYKEFPVKDQQAHSGQSKCH